MTLKVFTMTNSQRIDRPITEASPIQSILHINEKGGKFGGTEEYIDSLTHLLSDQGIRSHLIYEHLHGSLPDDLESSQKIPGLGNRDGDPELGNQVLQATIEINPDIVYLHNIFDGRIVEALDHPDRKYRLLWYIHDHFPTCLTELRALSQATTPLSKEGTGEMICDRPLSKNCLSNIDAGCCVKRHGDRLFSEADLSSRLELLKSLRLMDGIIVVSEFMKQILVKNLPDIENKIYVLPRQVRSPLTPLKKGGTGTPLTPLAKGETGTPLTPLAKGGTGSSDRTSQTALTPSKIVAFSGRITREKGLHVAIKALSELAIPEKIIFKIAGVIENPDYWSTCVELANTVESQNPSIQVQYLGHLSYENVDALYAEADIVVVPSIWGEPLGAVAAEAMRNGAVAIASNVGGLDTWVIHGQTGLLVNPNDPTALSEAIGQLLSDETLRSRLANAGQELINTRFTAREHLKALFEVIGKC